MKLDLPFNGKKNYQTWHMIQKIVREPSYLKELSGLTQDKLAEKILVDIGFSAIKPSSYDVPKIDWNEVSQNLKPADLVIPSPEVAEVVANLKADDLPADEILQGTEVVIQQKPKSASKKKNATTVETI